MKNSEKAKIAFKEELASISSKELVDLVLRVFDEIAEDDFFTVSASKSKRFHPECTTGQGGLIKHTKMVCWWANQLFRAFEQGYPVNKDAVIAACLIHDVVKNGTRSSHKDFEYEQGNGHIVSTHGTILGNMLVELLECPPEVAVCVTFHMGTWSVGHAKEVFDKSFCKDKNFVNASIVHLADYCASRKVETLFAEIESLNFEDLA